jgi:F-type H+-transporting ATPase subunit b
MKSFPQTVRVSWWLAAVLLACALCGSVGVRAQEKSPAAHPSTEPAAQQGSEGQQGFGAELAEESREAAGEDSHSEFKQSPAVHWLAYLTGGNVEYAYWLAVGLNFAAVFGIIFWACRKYLPGVFRNRTASIQRSMEEARRASADANRRLADIEQRLTKLGDEIKELTAASELEIAEEESRLKAATEEETRRIVEAAEQEIAAAAKAARRDLMRYAADLSVTLAQRLIHVDEPTDEALVRRFTDRITGEGSKN